jgi:hypothetical protein
MLFADAFSGFFSSHADPNSLLIPIQEVKIIKCGRQITQPSQTTSDEVF